MEWSRRKGTSGSQIALISCWLHLDKQLKSRSWVSGKVTQHAGMVRMYMEPSDHQPAISQCEHRMQKPHNSLARTRLQTIGVCLCSVLWLCFGCV